MTRKNKRAAKSEAPALNSPERNGLLARCAVLPEMRHAQINSDYGEMLGDMGEWKDRVAAMIDEGRRIRDGDLFLLSRLLTAQALSLDAMFTDLAHSAAINRSEYPHAFDRYMRLAMKAQSGSRATIEALARLHQPREQTVRHVHVNEGGQAVVADHFHNHTGAAENGKSVKQSDATGTIGAGTALPCPDAGGNGVPIASGEGQAAMQDARRHQSGRA